MDSLLIQNTTLCSNTTPADDRTAIVESSVNGEVKAQLIANVDAGTKTVLIGG